jgi:hypothetical protein
VCVKIPAAGVKNKRANNVFLISKQISTRALIKSDPARVQSECGPINQLQTQPVRAAASALNGPLKKFPSLHSQLKNRKDDDGGVWTVTGGENYTHTIND